MKQPRPLSAYTTIPAPGTSGMARLADAKPGKCGHCETELVGFTFARCTGWLCLHCDSEHYTELEHLGARHCEACEHTEHEHADPRLAPRCSVLCCPCTVFR